MYWCLWKPINQGQKVTWGADKKGRKFSISIVHLLEIGLSLFEGIKFETERWRPRPVSNWISRPLSLVLAKHAYLVHLYACSIWMSAKHYIYCSRKLLLKAEAEKRTYAVCFEDSSLKCFATSCLAALIMTHGYCIGSVFSVVLPSGHVHDCVAFSLVTSHRLGRSLGSIMSQFQHLEAVFDTCFGGPATSTDDQMTRTVKNWWLIKWKGSLYSLYSFIPLSQHSLLPGYLLCRKSHAKLPDNDPSLMKNVYHFVPEDGDRV